MHTRGRGVYVCRGKSFPSSASFPLSSILSPPQHPSPPQHRRHEGAPLPASDRPPRAPSPAPGLPGGAGRARGAAPQARSLSGRAGQTGTPLCPPALLFPLRKTFSFPPFRPAPPGPEGGEGLKERQGEGAAGGRGAGLPRDAPRPPGRPEGSGVSRARRRGQPACLRSPAGKRRLAEPPARGVEAGGARQKGAGSSPVREPSFSPGLRDGCWHPPSPGPGQRESGR